MADGIWVTSGPGLPCGARKLGDAGDGRVWLDVCIIGQHLPQMYRPGDMDDLTAEGCARLGLCPDCLGFGDLDPGLAAGMLEAARGVDQVKSPCPGCGGTGRPALRITIRRDGSGVQGSIRPLPHEYAPPLAGADPLLLAAFEAPGDMCLACGMPQDGTGPHGEALHTEQRGETP
jgi:hypothetical protein